MNSITIKKGGERVNQIPNSKINNIVNKQPLNQNTNVINDAKSKSKIQNPQLNKPTKLKKVGDGAYSTVHQGKHNVTHQKVAIKMIPNNKLNENAYNRVVSEIKILRSLNHKNIVKIMDFKKTTQNYYLIFEFCQNGDLESYIKKHYEGKISESLCQQVIFQVRDAFKQLTDHKIVHRDLKLANILVDEKFTIKIADFGFAKHNQDDDLLKSTLGTPITMAPEILYGKQYNQKCDIWSLGVIIYQMIFGKPPFMPVRGGGINGLINEIKKEVFTFPDEIPVSDELKNLLRGMLTVNPQKRIEFKELFSDKWITGEFKPSTKDLQGNRIDDELDLTQSLKLKKEQSKQKNIEDEIIQQQVFANNPKQITEDDEFVEEEQKENPNVQYDEDQEEGNEKDYVDIDIQTTQVLNDIIDVPTQHRESNIAQQQNLYKLTQNFSPQIDDKKNLIDIQKQEKQQVIAAIMKFALSLRKYYEKRIITFIANCNKYIERYEKSENSIYYQQNHFYRYSVFLNALIISSRISEFIKDNDVFDLGTYSQFSGIFLDKGENDINNYIHVLKKKLIRFGQIVQKLQETAKIEISTSNSPEYLFLQNIMKAYSFHQTVSSREEGQFIIKEMSDLLEIIEKLQLPSLQLFSLIRKQGVVIKSMFNEVKDMLVIIQETIKNDKKYVRYQSYPFEIKISILDQPFQEQQFIEIQKKLYSLINVQYNSSSISNLSSANLDFQLN